MQHMGKQRVGPTDLLRVLESAGRSAMPMAALARHPGLGLRTVQRTLSGEAPDATLGTTIKLAEALGVTLQLQEDHEMRRQTASIKAERLAGMVQGTSALEDQAVEPHVLQKITDRLRDELLVGPGSKLWNE